MNNDNQYRLPTNLSPFQTELYRHLITWKWDNITKEPGQYRGHAYDAILPNLYQEKEDWPHLYPAIRQNLKEHRKINPFRIHQHFYHMLSSQAAAINLFLPILVHPAASSVLRVINPEFASLDTDCLDNGYCLEYWGDNLAPSNDRTGSTGPLADKSARAGTDSDIAIAYRNHRSEPCLWLIEHKLTEKEFTECGGFRSNGRKSRHDCAKSFSEIAKSPQYCYYHDVRKFRYWEITKLNQDFFAGHSHHSNCPFRGGMNQLWRNQLLALAIEQDESQPFKHVHFSVLKHPGNAALDETLANYRELVGESPKFSVLTSLDVVKSAKQLGDENLNKWVDWYSEMYILKP